MVLPRLTLACPLVDGFVDYNCDQKYKVCFTGDSVVKGVGDTSKLGGGYVRRLQDALSHEDVENLGIPGINTRQLLRGFKKNLSKVDEGTTKKKSAYCDYLQIDIGRNDYWLRIAPTLTVTNIRRLVKYLRKELALLYETPPEIVVTTLIPTSRGFQRPFIEAVNELLLKEKNRDLPTDLRLDFLGTDILSPDGLHPNGTGYDEIARLIKTFIRTTAQDIAKANRSDQDGDGVYDRFEIKKFGTSPTLRDTDGDTLSDGIELFIYGTNPLLADTDGDGMDDGAELSLGRDPLVPDS